MAGKTWSKKKSLKEVLKRNPDGVAIIYRGGRWIGRQYGYAPPVMKSNEKGNLYVKLYRRYKKIMIFDEQDNLLNIDIRY